MNKEKSQQDVWDNIAEEWYEFKNKPAEETLKFLKGKKGNILDLGSGAGRHLINLEAKGKMYLVDFSKEMIELAKKRAKELKVGAEFYVADMIKLPFENEFFDYAVCISSLHCVEGEKNREKSVKELFRVLKKGAIAEIGVWDINSPRFKNATKEKLIKWRDKGARYYYLFDEKEVHNLFEKVGFKIKSTHNSGVMIKFIVSKQ